MSKEGEREKIKKGAGGGTPFLVLENVVHILRKDWAIYLSNNHLKLYITFASITRPLNNIM